MNKNTTSVTIEIDLELCENNQICEAVCVPGVLVLDGDRVAVRHVEECTVCFKCVEMCPTGAIAVDY